MYFFILSVIFTFIVSISPALHAEEIDDFVSKRFIVLKQTKSYADANKSAANAARKLKIKLDLRDLSEHEDTGLSASKKTCEENLFYYPCYVARGRYDDEISVSIEHADGYHDFKKGHFIVMLASSAVNNPEIEKFLKKAKAKFPEVFSHTERVYMGCIH
jgi:hypothetical protein